MVHDALVQAVDFVFGSYHSHRRRESAAGLVGLERPAELDEPLVEGQLHLNKTSIQFTTKMHRATFNSAHSTQTGSRLRLGKERHIQEKSDTTRKTFAYLICEQLRFQLSHSTDGEERK